MLHSPDHMPIQETVGGGNRRRLDYRTVYLQPVAFDGQVLWRARPQFHPSANDVNSNPPRYACMAKTSAAVPNKTRHSNGYGKWTQLVAESRRPPRARIQNGQLIVAVSCSVPTPPVHPHRDEEEVSFLEDFPRFTLVNVTDRGMRLRARCNLDVRLFWATLPHDVPEELPLPGGLLGAVCHSRELGLRIEQSSQGK